MRSSDRVRIQATDNIRKTGKTRWFVPKAKLYWAIHMGLHDFAGFVLGLLLSLVLSGELRGKKQSANRTQMVKEPSPRLYERVQPMVSYDIYKSFVLPG